MLVGVSVAWVASVTPLVPMPVTTVLRPNSCGKVLTLVQLLLESSPLKKDSVNFTAAAAMAPTTPAVE